MSPLFTTLFYCWSGHRFNKNMILPLRNFLTAFGAEYARPLFTMLFCCMVRPLVPGQFHKYMITPPRNFLTAFGAEYARPLFYKVILLYGLAIGAWAVSHKNMITPLGNFLTAFGAEWDSHMPLMRLIDQWVQVILFAMLFCCLIRPLVPL